MAGKTRIVGVSDVTLGFGSSQIPAFMSYLAAYYEAETIVLEPDQTNIPPKNESFQPIKLHRVTTTFDIYSTPGRIEYMEKASKLVDKLKPDVLVIFTTFCIPVLFRMHCRPKFVIYYALESVSAYGGLDVEMNSQIGSKVDLIIFPEENRAAKFSEQCGLRHIPLCIVFNCTNSKQTNDIVAPDKRNGRIIHQGRLRDDTGVDFYLNEKLQSIPIDLFGIVDGNTDTIMEQLTRLSANVRYKGSLDHKTLSEVRKHYIYSIVFWKPINENNLYACPNKFFESIAAGIPPITSPNPQCKMLTKRYNCGFVMDDWSFESFYGTIKLALESYGTEKYSTMIENCKSATHQELNWDEQMEKVKRFLKQI
jgi:glycosyltransferase involved in cell wall biosynthesis